MKKLLWVGDAGIPSGFALATHSTLETLRHHYDVTVLGMNYRGDPHDYPYPIYTALAGGDHFGIGRLAWMCGKVEPDVIVVQQDGWNVPYYVRQLAAFPEYAGIPVVAAVAVDGKNFDGEWLKGVAHAIFWTQFALDEARAGGYEGSATVIPLGVDTQTYRPGDKRIARERRGIESIGLDAFIVGNVNRNQPRKRWDLTIKYFAEWLRQSKAEDAYLYLHTAPTGDTGVDVTALAKYYGVLNRLLLMEPPTFYGISEESMRDTYNCFDVYVSTTQGEGMGLPAMEAMACRIPCVLPDWSAYGDWAKGAAFLVECTSTAIGLPYKNVIGGVADENKFVQAIEVMYRNRIARKGVGDDGFARVLETRFRWEDIGRRWAGTIGDVLNKRREEEWADLGRPLETEQPC